MLTTVATAAQLSGLCGRSSQQIQLPVVGGFFCSSLHPADFFSAPSPPHPAPPCPVPARSPPPPSLHCASAAQRCLFLISCWLRPPGEELQCFVAMQDTWLELAWQRCQQHCASRYVVVEVEVEERRQWGVKWWRPMETSGFSTFFRIFKLPLSALCCFWIFSWGCRAFLMKLVDSHQQVYLRWLWFQGTLPSSLPLSSFISSPLVCYPQDQDLAKKGATLHFSARRQTPVLIII